MSARILLQCRKQSRILVFQTVTFINYLHVDIDVKLLASMHYAQKHRGTKENVKVRNRCNCQIKDVFGLWIFFIFCLHSQIITKMSSCEKSMATENISTEKMHLSFTGSSTRIVRRILPYTPILQVSTKLYQSLSFHMMSKGRQI